MNDRDKIIIEKNHFIMALWIMIWLGILQNKIY